MLKAAIISVLQDNNFKNNLFEVNESFYYLKQEAHIRDALTKELSTLLNGKATALTEYPRGNDFNTRSRGRRDIGIFSLNNNSFDVKSPDFSIEIKFHYPLDIFDNQLVGLGTLARHKKDLGIIINDWKKVVHNNSTDCLIIVFCERDWIKNASISAAPSRQSSIDLLNKRDDLRQLLASKIEGNKHDFDFWVQIVLNSPTKISGSAETRYTFLVLFRGKSLPPEVVDKQYMPENATHQNPT